MHFEAAGRVRGSLAAGRAARRWWSLMWEVVCQRAFFLHLGCILATSHLAMSEQYRTKVLFNLQVPMLNIKYFYNLINLILLLINILNLLHLKLTQILD